MEEREKFQKLRMKYSRVQSVVLKRHAPSPPQLYNTLTKEEVAEKLKKQHKLFAKPQAIHFKSAITTLGKHQVTLEVSPGAFIDITLDIVKR